MSSGWKAIYDTACVLMADKDVANMAIKDNELVTIVSNFDNNEIEALLMDIIHNYNAQFEEELE